MTAAAYAAGAISPSDAVGIAYYRGVYSADVNRRLASITGAMLAVGLSQEHVAPYLAKVSENSVVVACINAPSNVTLSGDSSSVNELFSILKGDGVFVRKLRIQTAYHSHHMRVVAEDYLAAIGSLKPHQNKESSGVTMFSSVTAAPISVQELDASYWIQNMVSTVRFSEALKALVTQSAGGKTRRNTPVNYAAGTSNFLCRFLFPQLGSFEDIALSEPESFEGDAGIELTH